MKIRKKSINSLFIHDPNDGQHPGLFFACSWCNNISLTSTKLGKGPFFRNDCVELYFDNRFISLDGKSDTTIFQTLKS